MSSGVGQQAQGLATSQAATNAQQQAAQTAQNSNLTQQYEQIANNPGYTAAQQDAITNATEGGLGATYDALTQNASQRAAHTGNTAGYNDLLDQLATDKGSQGAQLAAGNQVAFANDAQSQQDAALKGLSGLYGTNADSLSKSLGLPDQYLNTAQTADNNSFGSRILGAFTSIPGAIAGGVGQGLGRMIGGPAPQNA